RGRAAAFLAWRSPGGWENRGRWGRTQWPCSAANAVAGGTHMARLSSMVIGVVALLGSLCGVAADDNPQQGDDAPKRVLSFPGPDTDAVVAFLGRIRD